METRSNNLLVGAVALLLLFAIGGFAIWLANAGSRNRVEYDIFFSQEVSGLNKGSPVKIKGVPAGQVKDIKLWLPDPRFVRVRIEVDPDTPVLQGTTAAISGVGFTGVSEVALDGARPGAAPITAIGRAGRPEIPTRLAGLGEILNTAPQLLQRISDLTERVAQLADDRNRESLAGILTNVDRITGNVADTTPQLDATLRDARAATRQAGEAAAAVARLADTTGRLVDRDGQAITRDLRRTIASTQQSVATLQSAIEEARPGLQSFSNRTIPEANALIRDLRQTSQSLGAVAERLDTQGAGGVLGTRLPDYEGKK